MSVIVKGMKFPENCLKCDIRGYDANAGEEYCPFTEIECLNIGRQDACPLVELPEKHGRLIDADALMEDIRKHSESYFADDFAHEWVDKQPTIIEAEGAEE